MTDAFHQVLRKPCFNGSAQARRSVGSTRACNCRAYQTRNFPTTLLDIDSRDRLVAIFLVDSNGSISIERGENKTADKRKMNQEISVYSTIK